AQQSCLILAISITKSEYIRSRMRLPTPNSKFDRDVTDILLNEPRQDSDLVQSRGRRSGQCTNFLLDLGGGIQASAGQVPIPIPHLLPAGESIGGRATGRKERDDH